MAITMHSCREQLRSTWIAQGGYEFVAEHLLREDSISTGIFWNMTAIAPAASEPPRHFPRARSNQSSVWSPRKADVWNRKDDIKRRIDEATKYISLDQLCLSPQCGFASTEEGNVLAEEEQWAKLRMIVELADEGAEVTSPPVAEA